MYKKNIALLLVVVFCLGLFFQYNRMDGFVRLLSNKNITLAFLDNAAADLASAEQEKYLLLYDPANIYSLYLKHVVDKTAKMQKKEIISVRMKELDTGTLNEYNGVYVAGGNLAALGSSEQALLDYVEQGGRIGLLMRPDAASDVDTRLAHNAGYTMFSEINPKGIVLKADLMPHMTGLKNPYPYDTSSLAVTLPDKAAVLAQSDDKIPLFWQIAYGKGKLNVYNGNNIGSKANRGILSGMFALAEESYVYPITGVKVVFLDDFPSPTPEGNFAKIYDEFGLSTADFYRQVWWPDMLAIAKKYNIKYTGVIIATYDNNVKPPFNNNNPTGKANLVIYGRELIKSGGELGIHGYNHQSLAGEGYDQEELDYRAWESQSDMEASLQALKEYVEAAYPDYKIRAYVPPSNILSSDGKSALKKVFPDLLVFCSLFNGVSTESKAYFQDFQENEDGTFEFPRTSAGYKVSAQEYWESMNALACYGIVSHFVHPDELFYEESKDLSWRDMKNSFEAQMKQIDNDFSWLRSCTISEAVAYFADYNKLEYQTTRKGNELEIKLWGNSLEVCFMLRSDKKVSSVQNCEITSAGEGWYVIKTKSPQISIKFEGE